jgi:hypothetical protein
MLAVLITLTPDCCNKFNDIQKAKDSIKVPLIMDVKTHHNTTLVLLPQADKFRDFTWEWLQNPIYNDYWAIFTRHD